MSDIIKAIEDRFSTNGAKVEYVERFGKDENCYHMSWRKGSYSEYGVIYARLDSDGQLVTQSLPFDK